MINGDPSIHLRFCFQRNQTGQLSQTYLIFASPAPAGTLILILTSHGKQIDATKKASDKARAKGKGEASDKPLLLYYMDYLSTVHGACRWALG